MKILLTCTFISLVYISTFSQACSDMLYGLRVNEIVSFDISKVNYVSLDTNTGQIAQLSPIEYTVKAEIAGIINDEYYFATSEGFSIDEIIFLDKETGVEKRRIDLVNFTLSIASSGCGSNLYALQFNSGLNYVSIDIYTGQITVISSLSVDAVTNGLHGIVNEEYFFGGDSDLIYLDLKTGVEKRRISKSSEPTTNYHSQGIGDDIYIMRVVDISSFSYDLFIEDLITGNSTQVSNGLYPLVDRDNSGILNNEFYFQLPEAGTFSNTDTVLVFLDLDTGLETKRIDLRNDLYKSFASDCHAVCICTNDILTYASPDIIPNGTNEWIENTINSIGGGIPVTVESGSTVNLRAAQSIHIDPQFEVELGAELLLDIVGCFSGN